MLLPSSECAAEEAEADVDVEACDWCGGGGCGLDLLPLNRWQSAALLDEPLPMLGDVGAAQLPFMPPWKARSYESL